jgi:hypothetical protein
MPFVDLRCPVQPGCRGEVRLHRDPDGDTFEWDDRLPCRLGREICPTCRRTLPAPRAMADTYDQVVVDARDERRIEEWEARHD